MNNINIKIAKIWPILAVLILINVSCKKNIVDDFTPVSERWEDVDQFLSSVDLSNTINIPNAEQEFVVELGENVFHFEDDAFVDEAGVVITGAITLQITGVYSSGDVILNNLVSSTGSDETLYSKALYKLDVYQDGVPLKLNNSKPYFIYVPSTTGAIFGEASFELQDFSGAMKWFPTINFNVSLDNWDFTVNGINHQGSGYKLKVYNNGWAHLASYEDVLYKEEEYYGKIVIDVPEAFINAQTRVYIAYASEICAISLEKQGNTFINDRILIDREMKVIYISTINDELYYDQKHFIGGEINNFSLNPSKTDYIELYTNLKKL